MSQNYPTVLHGTLSSIQLVDPSDPEAPAFPTLAVASIIEPNGRLRVAYCPADLLFDIIRDEFPSGHWRNQPVAVTLEGHLLRGLKRDVIPL